jgi:hypothetical protein
MNSASAICCLSRHPGGFTSAQRVQTAAGHPVWLARAGAGSGVFRGNDEGTLSMWAFFSRRLRMWLLLAIALPLTRALVHRLALAAQRRDSSTRTAKALHQADSTVTAVSQRAARKGKRRAAEH